MPRADIAILTVIPEEYEAVIASLSSYGCKTEHDPGSATVPNLYGWIRGDLPGAGGQVYRVVVGNVVKPGPGRMASAVSATYNRYKPQYVLIVGIEGGFPQDELAKGDVAISGVIYDYEYGKVATDFHPRMDFTYQPDQALLTSAVSLHARDKFWAARDRQMRPDGGAAVPKLLQGAIASGGKVIDDATNDFFAAVLKAWPKLLAVEMEGAGAAAEIETLKAAKENVGFMMVRGISDMPKMGHDAQPTPAPPEGNKAERDKWKRYAATTAANFTVHWIARAWPLAPRRTTRSDSTAAPEGEDDDDPLGAAQHASIGNVTGSNNTVTITQTQGPSLEDLARLIQTAVPDANSAIDVAVARLKADEPDIAIHMLEEFRRKRWDTLSPREKYRTAANMGHALEKKGEFKKSAKYYLEANSPLK
jgi:nucleoside phosphorylase